MLPMSRVQQRQTSSPTVAHEFSHCIYISSTWFIDCVFIGGIFQDFRRIVHMIDASGILQLLQ